MLLLVDSDAFCKLAASDLLSDALAILGTQLVDCGRLPALPHMLRRGALRRVYGESICERLIPIAEGMPVVERPPGRWLERLTPVTDIDPGEAILFAAAAEQRIPVITGDMRALRALKALEEFPVVLDGRIVTIEAILLALCRQVGTEIVRERVERIRTNDSVIGICFSPANTSPDEALASYLRDRQTELAPLVLWKAAEGGVP